MFRNCLIITMSHCGDTIAQIAQRWLPPYSPSLNLIERLRGHLKRTILANVLFKPLKNLIAVFHKGIARINGHRERMGFMFNHKTPRKKTA